MNDNVSILKCQFDSFNEYVEQACPAVQLAGACLAYPAYIEWFIQQDLPGEPMDIWTFANSDTCALIATQKARAYGHDIYELLKFMPKIDQETAFMLGMLGFVSQFDDDED